MPYRAMCLIATIVDSSSTTSVYYILQSLSNVCGFDQGDSVLVALNHHRLFLTVKLGLLLRVLSGWPGFNLSN